MGGTRRRPFQHRRTVLLDETAPEDRHGVDDLIGSKAQLGHGDSRESQHEADDIDRAPGEGTLVHVDAVFGTGEGEAPCLEIVCHSRHPFWMYPFAHRGCAMGRCDIHIIV